MEKLDLKNNKIEIILIFMSIKSGNLLQEGKKKSGGIKIRENSGIYFQKKKVQEVKYPEKEGKSFKIYLKQKYSWQQLEKTFPN